MDKGVGIAYLTHPFFVSVGCGHPSSINNDNRHGNESIVAASNAAIQYFKETYDLEVQITSQNKLPTYVADEIDVGGFVIGHPDQTFNLSVNYKTLETGHLVMSPELDRLLKLRNNPSLLLGLFYYISGYLFG
ncbi:hypothetical protein MKY82_04420 [Paenibacillus sp. FSL W7-1279]|uniref:hypothetical protein n=1 Tax=Paenibacillus TaxID=44249 RepID=UPI001C7D5B69|nr:hypothetical protein [Paenibacillus lautus]MBX4150896.1 hypothetical protein [Paenibacillus lautus]